MKSKQAPAASSGFRGVTADGAVWKVQITVDGKPFNIGKFNDPELAAYIYDCACLTLGRPTVNNINPSPAGMLDLVKAYNALGWVNVQHVVHGLMRIQSLAESEEELKASTLPTAEQ